MSLLIFILSLQHLFSTIYILYTNSVSLFALIPQFYFSLPRDFHGTCNEEARIDNYIFPEGSQPIVCDILDFDKYLTGER